MKHIKILALLAALLLTFAVPAMADELNVPNTALVGLGTGGTNTFGTVTYTLSNTGVMTVTFTMDPTYFIKTNTSGHGSVGFQVTGTNFVLGNLSGTDGDGNTYTPLAASLSTTNSVPVPGAVGTYNVLVDLGNPVAKTTCKGKPPVCTTVVTTEAIKPGLVTLTFTVSGVTDLDPAKFFAHVVTSFRSGGSNITGYVGNGPGSIPTPEPASLFLMGTGLLGFGSAVRKRFKK